ncbi:hypothetical protein JHK87_055070 [Glycine soja]|nr:hypothetical protein JHK87_055070 [Glycine soja]
MWNLSPHVASAIFATIRELAGNVNGGAREPRARSQAAPQRLRPDPGHRQRPPRCREANHQRPPRLVDCTCQDLDLIKKQYRRLDLLLHPYKNPFSLADKHLGKTCDWIVALKALMLVNEGPSLFQEEILFAASVPGILGSEA